MFERNSDVGVVFSPEGGSEDEKKTARNSELIINLLIEIRTLS